MINEARTLLLNPWRSQLDAMRREPLHHHVDPNYRRVFDSPESKAVQTALFGSDPDGWTLNVLAQRYMSLLDTPEYAAEIRRYDRRISHDLTHPPMSGSFYRPQLRITSGHLDMKVIGRLVGNLETGRNQLRAFGTIDSFASNWQLQFKHPEPTEVTYDSPSGVFTSYELQDTGVTLQISDTGETLPASFGVTAYARPALDVPTAIQRVDTVRSALKHLVERSPSAEVYFQRYQNSELDADRLAGALMTLIEYRKQQSE